MSANSPRVVASPPEAERAESSPRFDYGSLAAIATTPQGAQVLLPLCQTSGMVVWVPTAVMEQMPPSSHGTHYVRAYDGSLREHLAQLWTEHQGFIFCLAMGAVVRLVAPLLQGKQHDPAVVVVDEGGHHAISGCSGHQGQGDELARWVATQLNATPILTGAANHDGRMGLDVMGRPWGWQRGPGHWTGVSAAIARHEAVTVVQEAGTTLWRQHLPSHHSFQWCSLPEYDAATSSPTVWISPYLRTIRTTVPDVQWYPRVLWLGIGCERDTPKCVIDTAIQQALTRYQLSDQSIAGIASLDLKASELGLVELCRDRAWPLRCFTAEELRQVEVPNPSSVVEQAVGTASVAEAAALVAAAPTLDSAPVQVEPELIAPKQVYRLPDQPGAVTVAIAQSPQDYLGTEGALALVGMGPGHLDQMTPAAKGAIMQADAVIGYGLYLDLIQPLLRPGQIIESLPITQERQRAERAIALARWGLSVAVVSSGDCGIYGMAGLVMEQLHQDGWDGRTPAVQVFPGVTALQAAAARVGAPLMHDFCAISLSDLLTPWAVIEKRLEAAAQADFVTALYNPKSKTRVHQIAIAHKIFLQHRHPNTPVALVRSAYREDEAVTLTTLEKLGESAIDMMTVVLIGNSSTRQFEQWLITPRGYLPQIAADAPLT